MIYVISHIWRRKFNLVINLRQHQCAFNRSNKQAARFAHRRVRPAVLGGALVIFDDGGGFGLPGCSRSRSVASVDSASIFRAVKMLGGWGSDLNDDRRIEQHVAMFVQELQLAANDNHIRIRKQSFG